MSYLLKDLYSRTFYDRIGDVFAQAVPGFNKPEFFKDIYATGFEDMELKERMRHTSVVLHKYFPSSYIDTVALIRESINMFREQGIGEDGLPFMFLPDYIQVYGMEDYKTSVKAIEFITQFVSCEYAVRPFLIRYPDKMMAQMFAWSKHKHYKVRRLASEGTRTRLPWGLAVPWLKKSPESILPLLENLKSDPSEWVRRSVANSLNDITRDKPELVVDIAKRWKGISAETDAIIKHGSRTLVKQGHTDILKHYGLESGHFTCTDLNIHTPRVKIGESLSFSFEVRNNGEKASTLRLEYAIYYRKQNGQPSKKVFKISEKNYPPGITFTVNRSQKFVLITTRTFYLGSHQLGIILNGDEKLTGAFELV